MDSSQSRLELTYLQGSSGLTKRDIQLFVEGGFHTVEAVAYTYAICTLLPLAAS